MSAAINTSFDGLSTIMRNVDKLNATNDALTGEISSGVTSNSYAGLGDQAYAAISLQPQISATLAWQTNLAQTQAKLAVTQTALTSISSIANGLRTTLISLQSTPSASTISAASASAKLQLTALTALLNTRSGSSYVFAGTASDQAPVKSPDLANDTTGSMISDIISSVAAVAVNGAGATEAATLVSASDPSSAVSIFSAQLSTAATANAPRVQVGQNQSVATGIVATQGGSASATGSSIRDLIRSLATVAGLSGVPGADTSSADFRALVSDTSGQMTSVVQGLAGLTASVGTLQDGATSLSSNLSDMNAALTSQLDTAKGADIATSRTQQIAVQNQLTASYTLIADMRTLNLAQYL